MHLAVHMDLIATYDILIFIRIVIIILFAVPFISITEQNAAQYQRLLDEPGSGLDPEISLAADECSQLSRHGSRAPA